MKILCDVCNKDGASFFCAADDAALCSYCDHRVHHVNKLAGKHQRFSLINPSSPEKIPLCDICQVKRAFLFCQQDRAILCIDCDYSIHKANEHTQNHNRFLLTGTKLSVDSNSVSQLTPPPAAVAMPVVSPDNGTSSSISEYLIETLPGWRVDDFLDSYAQPNTFDLSKEVEEDLVIPIWENNEFNLNSGIWVPQAPAPAPATQYTIMSPPNMTVDGESNSKSTVRKWMVDDGSFTVPQMSPQSSNQGSKRSRFAW
ncbi:B-box zinc finger protein 21-like [Impatiens glandulifera]|uniref:B-box zinc finger protein 21-like n=1 Tax=Impatiens glandulifera TaxID=253017 RepID=UPI001FB0DAB3|nr:B-box zinc finger protein 21-like [Impatiens glandulifera]